MTTRAGQHYQGAKECEDDLLGVGDLGGGDWRETERPETPEETERPERRVEQETERRELRAEMTPRRDDRRDESIEERPRRDATTKGFGVIGLDELVGFGDFDLKMIAECMISLGYSKECVKIYKIIRKSIIDEGLYRLGIERLSSHQIQKMEWEVLEVKIKSWLGAMKVAVNTLFAGERFLCDFVFSVGFGDFGGGEGWRGHSSNLEI
ncbi:hypothetical protein Syun_029390 [Stephania yunnanensis]|uniref:Uncharacterized protein n=1 Tax=Stephania yunnanensis TaxID=152371 RepID=A0AAP0E5J3_9MAGN